MAIDVNVPSFPESVADGSVIAWHKQPGDPVSRDEVLAEIETDKVVFEVPAPEDGVLLEILENEGATVLSQQLLARIDAGAVASKPAASEAPVPAVEDKAATAADVAIAPAARKLMAEQGLDAAQVSGSGKGGRILKEDVLKVIDSAPATKSAAPAKAALATPVVTDNLEGRPEKRVPMSRLRARVAERLLEAQHNAAMLTTFNEVNMKPVMELRARHRDAFEKAHDVRLGFMSFFVKAAVEALKQIPAINASIEGTDVIYHGFYDIGIAVSSPRGLVVPVLRDVDQMSMAEIEAKIRELAQKAQNKSLSIEDISGGTFTITNGGVFGSMLSTPIINPPQSGILGMHNIQDRAMVVNGEVVVLPMMYLAHSYDHRLIDGKEAVQFLVKIKQMLEDPARILLEV
ncbi:MAG: 2-oxoglutarate dehydrogenase complex dihydrolipoyllysine-residue succinyltransferase [Thiotrichaceae bacterium]|nr:2-oxoglutarate dehydrogenase complex dihydrolipoyllysine-residue succinyltransferase [Thiotrichaceae bacterium]PCI13470.1 MAG: dihydrolipoyllysine-residue succinyltransferase [Thiotrichales bacterium]